MLAGISLFFLSANHKKMSLLGSQRGKEKLFASMELIKYKLHKPKQIALSKWTNWICQTNYKVQTEQTSCTSSKCQPSCNCQKAFNKAVYKLAKAMQKIWKVKYAEERQNASKLVKSTFLFIIFQAKIFSEKKDILSKDMLSGERERE